MSVRMMLNSPSVMRLTLVRHAVTQWNLGGRVQGQSDVPLSPLGELQARALRQRFTQDFAGDGFTGEVQLYSSPLSRARTTAALAFPECAPVLDARLSELNFGRFEGLTLKERLTLPEWHTWTRAPFSTSAPGGESYGELYGRAEAWLTSLSGTVPADAHVVAVTHSGTIQTLVAQILQIDTKAWRKRIHLEHTSITSFVVTPAGLVLERLNDTQHLSPDLQTVPAVSTLVSTHAPEPPEKVRLDP